MMQRAWVMIWPPFLLLCLSLAAWESIVHAFDIPAYLVPAPSVIAKTFFDNSELLLRASMWTAFAAIGGLLVSALVGVLVGTIIASSTFLYRGAYPIATLLQMVPLVAIAPLLVIWFGYGVKTSLASAAIVSLFPVIANTVDGLRGTNRQWIELFDLYKIRGWTRWRKLLLPAATPNIVTGLKIAAGLAVIGAIVGEFVGGFIGDQSPLGSVIMSSLRQARTDLVFAAIGLGAIVGFILFGLVTVIGHLALGRWHASAASND
ncbi:MAG: ABC transporter permease [Planctomycetota bacterium]|nr:ABC transporter permease [Planctomycetota bacterium]